MCHEWSPLSVRRHGLAQRHTVQQPAPVSSSSRYNYATVSVCLIFPTTVVAIARLKSRKCPGPHEYAVITVAARPGERMCPLHYPGTGGITVKQMVRESLQGIPYYY